MTTFRKLNKNKLTRKVLSEMLLATAMSIRTMTCLLRSNTANNMKREVRWVIHQLLWRTQKLNEIFVLSQWDQHWWIISARNSILHQKNEISSLHITSLRCNFYLSSSTYTQIHESIVDVRHDNEDDLSKSEDERTHRNDKTSKVNDERGALQRDNDDMNASIRRTKKRHRFAIEKKFPLKRRIKRHRFSSSFLLDEKDETKFESDTSNYAFVESYRMSNHASVSSLLSLSLDRERESKSKNKHESIDKMCRQHSLSRTTIVYEQQCWEEEILQERDVRQKRERFRKQHLIRWKESWMNDARLTSSNLLRNWREKKTL